MIYDEPAFKTMGDTAINVEFGDETSIPLNFQHPGTRFRTP